MYINTNLNIKSNTQTILDFNIISNLVRNLKQVIGINKVIGVYINKSVDMILIIYAILLSSNIYLPLDKSYPIDKIKYYISKGECEYIITDSFLKFDNCKQILTDELFKYNYSSDINFIYNEISYILFTSGTTGNPKGTINKYSSLINHMKWLIETFNFNENDIILQKTPISFDASTWEIYLPLFTKMKMFVCENDDYKDPKKLAEVIINNKITIIQIVPSIGEYLYDQIKKIDINYKLKYIFCGGEALSFKLAQILSEISENIVNLYGPSECCCNTIYYKYKKTDDLVYNSLYCPIGTPIRNTQIKIINRENNIGELLISGSSVGLGYINNKILTNEKFITIDNILYYKTGDIVKINDDNTLLFCNRTDTQIKINGQRIEMDEIKECIYFHPLVKECQIIIHKNLIICAIIPKNIDINILKCICNHNLEKFKRPSLYKTYDVFPVLNNGKIDLKMIASSYDIITNTNTFNDIENKIIRIISNISNINENLFTKDIEFAYIGIDSLTQYIITTKINKEFNSNIYVRDCNSISNIIKNLNNNESKYISNNDFLNILDNIINKSNKIIGIHSSLIDFNLNLVTLKPLFQKFIVKKISEGYTFLLPTFNYSFCNNNFYDYKYSQSEVGILGEWILEIDTSIRTTNPIFSWAVIGNNKDDVLKCNNNTCFGENSVFDYLYNNDSSYILIGCKHFTQLHYCEEKANVDWRFYKKFNGIVNFDKKNQNFDIKMYCRKLDCKSNLGFLYFDLIYNDINKVQINDSVIYSFNTNKICNILINLFKKGLLKPV